METTKTARMLIAAKPGIMRNSLLSYLRTLSGVQIIALADDAADAVCLIRTLRPHLVVIDSDLSEDKVLPLVQAIRAEPSAPKLIVLVDSIRQQEQCRHLGVQHALLKGFLDEQLGQAIASEI